MIHYTSFQEKKKVIKDDKKERERERDFSWLSPSAYLSRKDPNERDTGLSVFNHPASQRAH